MNGAVVRSLRVVSTLLVLVSVAIVFPDRNFSLSSANAATTGSAPCVQTVSSDTGVAVSYTGGKCVVQFTSTSASIDWTSPTGVTSINLLVVGGGGGGGSRHAGGGGGGGVSDGTVTISPATQYRVTVGAGGTGGTAGLNGSEGSQSSFKQGATPIAYGDGGEGGGRSLTPSGGRNGLSSSSPSSRNLGGTGSDACTMGWCGGGGAGAVGAGQAGDASDNNKAGDGGSGVVSSISGSSRTYGGGGGGSSGSGSTNTDPGSPGGSGADGGGAGGTASLNSCAGSGLYGATTGQNGTVNSGGGGGGGGYWNGNVDAGVRFDESNCRISASGGAGGSGIVIVSYTPVKPDAPTSLLATAGNAQVSLSWTAPVSSGAADITDYVVEYQPSGGSWTTFSDGTSTTTSATVTGLTNGTAYDFRVSATSAAGTGNASSTATATPSASSPGSPTELAGTGGASQVALTWTVPASNGGSAITDYVVEYQPSGGSWTTFADGTSTSTSATVTGLTNGTSYSFRVSAVNSAGTGSASSSVTVTAGALPGAPTTVRVLAGARQISASWTAPANNGGSDISDYVVQYCTGGSCTTFSDGTSTTASAVITGLTNGTAYTVKVAAVTAVGQGDYSTASASATPSATLTFEATAAARVTLGALATRSQCQPLTKQGVGPYTYSGTDSNGVAYSYQSNRNESGVTLRASKEVSSSSLTTSRDPNASYSGRSGVLQLTSSGTITFTNSCSYSGSNVSVYGSVFGPEVYTAPFSATSGQSVSVSWAAAGGGDDYEVYAFLVRVGGGAAATYEYGSSADHSLLLYSRGVTQAWTTASGDIPSDGVYRFRFVNGTFDYTGYKGVGATMYIDPATVVGDTNTITFGTLSDRISSGSDQTFSISASATSGGAVNFTSSTTPKCTVGASTTSGGSSTATLTVLASQTGLCTINADSAATGNYATAQTLARSFTILASATAPSNSGGTGHTGTAALGSILTVAEGSWADGGSAITGTTYLWQRSANNSTWTSISGATSSTYELTTSDVANYVRVTVTKTNSVGSTTANGTATGVIPDTRLSNLAVSVGTLSPTFAAGTFTYSSDASSSDSTITVTPTASSGSATITVNGTSTLSGSGRSVNLEDGTNTITIVVTTASVTTTTTLTVTRAAGPVVTAPSAPTFASNTSGQDPGNFVISNFDPSATLSVSIGFVDPPSGTSFVLPVTTGLTPGTGYSFSGNLTQMTFTGNQANANAALAAMTVSTGSSTGNVVMRVTAAVDRANTYYNPINGNYYEVVTRASTYAWSATAGGSAFDLAETRTLYGVTGYLATITSAQEQKFVYDNISGDNIWLGATDDFELINLRCGANTFANQSASEGNWYWVSGPVGEKCTKFWQGNTGVTQYWINSSTGNTQTRDSGNVSTSRYENWCTGNATPFTLTAGRSMGEPNDAGAEHYLLEKWNGARCWNDWGRKDSGVQSFYLVEYSGSFSGSSSATATVTGVVDVLSPEFSTETTRISSGGPYTFTVTFGVAVSGVASADFEDAGSGSSCTYSVTAVSTTVYTLTASSCFAGSAEGTVIPRFKANGATRADGVNTNTGPLAAVTSTVTVTRDTTAPTVTSFSSTTSNGSYRATQSVNITATTSESVQSGNTITVTLDTGATVTLTAASAGTSLTGTYTVAAGDNSADLNVSSFTVGTVADTTGNAMTSTTVPSGVNNIAGVKAIVIDTTAPAAIGIPDLDVSSDTGASSSDNVTTDNTPTINVSVTALEVGATGTVRATKVGSSNVTCTLVAGVCTLGTLAEGTWTIVSFQTDAAGNVSADSAPLSVTIDRIAPTTVALARSSATSSVASISYTVTGSEGLDCATLSTTATAISGTDFVLTAGLSAITSIVQTSSTVCTVNATSTATAGGGAVTSTLTASGTFSVADTAGNAKTTLTGSPQSITVAVPAPPSVGTTTTTSTTTTSTTTTTVAPSTTVTPTTAATTTTTVVRRVRRTTTTSVRAVVVTTTTSPMSVTTTTVRRVVAPTTSVRVISGTTTTSSTVQLVAPTTSVRVIVGTTTTTVDSPIVAPSTTLPLTREVTSREIQEAIDSGNSNVQDLSLPVFVESQLPNPEPGNPLVIQTESAVQLDIITVNDQVVQLQDTDGFRLSVSATDSQGILSRVNTRGAIVVERENSITVTGEGFKPGSDVVAWLFSEPRRLGVIRVAGDGSFEASLPINSDVPQGDHTAQVNGMIPSGDMRSLNLAVEVIDAKETSVNPVVTDTTIDPLIVAASGPRNDTSARVAILVLGLVIGAALMWFLLARRRRRDEPPVQ